MGEPVTADYLLGYVEDTFTHAHGQVPAPPRPLPFEEISSFRWYVSQ